MDNVCNPLTVTLHEALSPHICIHIPPCSIGEYDPFCLRLLIDKTLYDFPHVGFMPISWFQVLFQDSSPLFVTTGSSSNISEYTFHMSWAKVVYQFFSRFWPNPPCQSRSGSCISNTLLKALQILHSRFHHSLFSIQLQQRCVLYKP